MSDDSRLIAGGGSASQTSFADEPPTVIEHQRPFHTFTNEDGGWAVTAAQRYPVDIEEKLYIECKPSIGHVAARAEGVRFPTDHFLTLIYYNVLRGLVWNIPNLGLDPTEIEKDECASPFTSSSLTDRPAVKQLPPSLPPTLSQQKKHHHPYIDIFPCAVVRNKIIQHEVDINGEDDGLCMAIFGIQTTCDTPGGSTNGEMCTSTTLWGDPWGVEQWEMFDVRVRCHKMEAYLQRCLGTTSINEPGQKDEGMSRNCFRVAESNKCYSLVAVKSLRQPTADVRVLPDFG